MNIWTTIIIGFKEIGAHKFRSFRTMLGIILGVSSLIAMGGLNKVLLREQDVPAFQQHLADQAPGRTMKDVRALLQGATLIRTVSPE